MRGVVAGIVLLSLGCGSVLHAAAWVPPSGTNGGIGYTGGQDVNGLFENPAVAEQKFVFATPSSFLAVSPGTPVSSTDTASVNATSAQDFASVFARVQGDYTFSESPAQLTYSAKLTVDYGSGPVDTFLVFVPPSPISSGEGEFIGTATFTLPAGITSLSASLLATIGATSSDPGTTEIQIKNAELSFTTIPEPTSLGLLASAASLLLRRRRA